MFQQADQHINEAWGWIPNVQAAYDALDSAFASAANGHGTFATALASAQKSTVNSLTSAGLKVSTP